MFELVQDLGWTPLDLLLIVVLIPAAVAGLSIPFTIYMAWHAKSVDVPPHGGAG